MGSNYSCGSCCVQPLQSRFLSKYTKELNPESEGQKNITVPEPEYAKPVSSIIDIPPTVRKIYKQISRTKLPYPKLNLHRSYPVLIYYIFSIKAYYDGQWSDGLPHGSGRLYFDSGCFYEGSIASGKLDGEGLFIYADGSYFKGKFKDNKAEGPGMLCSGDVIYNGSWENSAPNGKGTEKRGQQASYSGNFRKGQRQGFGRYQWSQSEYYQGNFLDGQMSGWGLLETEQYTHQGFYQGGKKQGFGKLTYKNHDSYQGQFFNDLRHGQGVFTWQNGCRLQGIFEKDNLVKCEKFFQASGKEVLLDGGIELTTTL